MSKDYITLKPTEQAIVTAAATIYAGYLAAGRVEVGSEAEWLKKSTQDAIHLAKATDEKVVADGEFN